MGLYAGISILTGAEFLVLIVKLFKTLILGFTTSDVTPEQKKDGDGKIAKSAETVLSSLE